MEFNERGNARMKMNRVFEEIDRSRGRFLGMAGLSLAAIELGLARFATRPRCPNI
jgi:hypothetical protein